MADYSYIQARFWNDPDNEKLTPATKLVFIYLFSCPQRTQSGIFSISKKRIAFDTGLQINIVEKALDKLIEKRRVKYDGEILWIVNFVKHQVSSSPKVIKRMSTDIKQFEQHPFVKEFLVKYKNLFSKLIRIEENQIKISQREAITIRDNFKCVYCRKEITSVNDLEIDHIIPLLQGGKSNYSNMVLSCKQCNQKKKDKTPQQIGWHVTQPCWYHKNKAIKTLYIDGPTLNKFNDIFNKSITINDLMNTLYINKNRVDIKENTGNIKEKKIKEKKRKVNKEYILLASKLGDLILERKPDYKTILQQKEKGWIDWANDIRLMVERDNRDLGMIEKIIEFCQKDDFWQDNILSTGKLRKQFDKLDLKYQKAYPFEYGQMKKPRNKIKSVIIGPDGELIKKVEL